MSENEAVEKGNISEFMTLDEACSFLRVPRKFLVDAVKEKRIRFVQPNQQKEPIYGEMVFFIGWLYDFMIISAVNQTSEEKIPGVTDVLLNQDQPEMNEPEVPPAVEKEIEKEKEAVAPEKEPAKPTKRKKGKNKKKRKQ